MYKDLHLIAQFREHHGDYDDMDCLIVGCGLCGMVIARFLAEHGKRVHIVERRRHIGGNIYDYRDENGLLVQKYGPHSFFTDNIEVKRYIERYTSVKDCYLEYVTMINGHEFPMPFNFKAIDMLYGEDKGNALKEKLKQNFPKWGGVISVSSLIKHEDGQIAEFGRFMYENEYRLYTAKQWGRPIETISPDVFGRVPVYLSYKKEYEPHKYQFVPKNGFTDLAERLLDDGRISYELNVDATEHLKLNDQNAAITWDDRPLTCPIVYTGPLDELFGFEYGRLPYRSLEFIWKTAPVTNGTAAIVAWPQAETVTRVTDFCKLPVQETPNGKTTIAIEIPFEYDPNRPFGNEPYYPIDNVETRGLYNKYRQDAERFSNLFVAGRLGEYKYYNMDHTILNALKVAERIMEVKNG